MHTPHPRLRDLTGRRSKPLITNQQLACNKYYKWKDSSIISALHTTKSSHDAPYNSKLVHKSLEWASQSLVHLATAATCAAGAQDLLSISAAAVDTTQGCSIIGNLTAFFILSSVFVDDEEHPAAVAYTSGLACSFLLLARVHYMAIVSLQHSSHAIASSFPSNIVFLPCTVLVMLSIAMNIKQSMLPGTTRKLQLKHTARDDTDNDDTGNMMWESWKHVTLCVGCCVLPQIAYTTFVTTPQHLDTHMWHVYPLFASFIMLCGAFYLYITGKKEGFFRDVAPWCATLLFMIDGVQSTQHESLWRFALPALSTGLQVPRAHLVKNSMWRLGTTWATFFTAVKASTVAWVGYNAPCVAVMLMLCVCAYLCIVFAIPWKYTGSYCAGNGKMIGDSMRFSLLPYRLLCIAWVQWKRSVSNISRLYFTKDNG